MTTYSWLIHRTHGMETSRYSYRSCGTFQTYLLRSKYGCKNMLKITSSLTIIYTFMVGIVPYAATLLMKKQKKSLMISMEECVVVIYSNWK